MKSRPTYSKDDLEQALKDKVPPTDLTKIISAYEMSENAHHDHLIRDGSPYFGHISRVCGIIVEELSITDPDIITASLIHAVHKSTDEITAEIIDYNFGPYVRLLFENFSEERETLDLTPTELKFDIQDKIRVPGDDYLIIKLSAILDMLRSIDFNPIYNPIGFINETSKKYFAIVESSDNKHLLNLVSKIRKERNKIIG